MEKEMENIFGELEKIYFCDKSKKSREKILLSIKKMVVKEKGNIICNYNHEYLRQLLEDIETVFKRGSIESEVVDIADCYLYGYHQVIDDIKAEL